MKKNAVNFMMLIFAIVINIVAINAQTKSPTVEVTDENNNKQNLILKKLDIDIKVVGNLAVTTMDMTFTNDFPKNSRALEGTLIFPLSEGQSVNRLAMDFNGIMREGVIVEKEKGRVVFEEIERRGVDPALLEMTTSNNYKLRIFPIMPGKERRIIIAYEEILKSNSDGMTYNLPLEFEKEINEFNLKANVFNEVQPIVDGKSKFEKDDNSYNLEYEYSDYKAKEMFSFSIPTPENQESILCEMIDGERFFVVNRSIEIPQATKIISNKITILWDCSHSSNKRDVKKEIELLREYFKANPNCSVELITFNYKIKSKKDYKIVNGNADELIKVIEKVRYDGGSNFDCIDLSKNKSDIIMMFTDGISSLGNSKTLESKTPINTINSNLSANNFYLNDIANTSGGSYINLLNSEIESAMKVLIENQYRLISIENTATETEEIFPQNTQNLIQDLSIAGKMESDKAQIKLNFGYGNKIEKTETIIIDANDNKVESEVLSRIWAKKKLDNLAMNPKKNKAEILAIGQKYNIVSQNTSLIVLETAWDYIKYKIEPPKSDTALLNSYNKLLVNEQKAEEERTKYERKNPNQNLERLIANFKGRKKWYSANFIQKIMNEDSIINYNEKIKLKYEDSVRTYNHRADSIRSNNYKMNRNKNKKLVTKLLNLQNKRIDSLTTIFNTISDSNKCTGEGTIEGRILLDDLGPAFGATIRILGTNRGAKIKSDGKFTLASVPCGKYKLGISYNDNELVLPGELSDKEILVIGEIIIKLKTGTQSQANLNSIIGETGCTSSTDNIYPIRGSRISETTRTDGVYTIRGSRGNESTIRLDGIEVSNPLNGGAITEDVIVTTNKIDLSRTSSKSVIGASQLQSNSREGISSIVGSTAGVQSASDGYSIRGSRAEESTIRMENNQVTSKSDLSAYSSSETYFTELKALEGEAFWDKYFEYKAKFGNVIGYYIDIAELLTKINNLEDAEEVITNIAELGDENQEFMRVVAYKLQNLKKYDLAKNVFEYIAEIRAEEPQSFRDLAIINEEIGNYQAAADLYYKVALSKWDGRFFGVEMTALTELNTLIANHTKEIDTTKFNSELMFAMPLDVRVVLRWDLDNTDIDLWVTDPRNERCWYSHKDTRIGGLLPKDFTGGNGPEEFLLKSAMKGKYIIECNYFGSRATKLTGGTTIFLDIYTNYGKPNEKKETKVLRLKENKQTIKIGEIEIE